MTSELKIDLTSFGYADGGYMSKCSHCKETFLGAKRSWSCKPCAIKKILEPKITRAVPDVPELVRYGEDWSEDTGKLMMVKLSEGEYVRHDQAAAVIAAKDGRITDYKNLVDALHAKLAQYEAQDPVGYISEYGLNKLASRAFHQMVDVRKSIEGDHTIPLYASPAPAADLKAVNERLREALQDIANLYQPRTPIQRAINIARAALNVVASDDK